MELIKPSKSSQAKQVGSLVDKYACTVSLKPYSVLDTLVSEVGESPTWHSQIQVTIF